MHHLLQPPRNAPASSRTALPQRRSRTALPRCRSRTALPQRRRRLRLSAQQQTRCRCRESLCARVSLLLSLSLSISLCLDRVCLPTSEEKGKDLFTKLIFDKGFLAYPLSPARNGCVAADNSSCMNFAHPEKVLYHCTTSEKIFYENARCGQGFVLLVQLPRSGKSNLYIYLIIKYVRFPSSTIFFGPICPPTKRYITNKCHR
jgi:hypothetical protein